MMAWPGQTGHQHISHMWICLCRPWLEQVERACAGRQLSQLPAEPTECRSNACNANLPEEPIDSMDAWLPDEVEAWSPPCCSRMPSLLWSEASTVCRQAQSCLWCLLSLRKLLQHAAKHRQQRMHTRLHKVRLPQGAQLAFWGLLKADGRHSDNQGAAAAQ